MPWEGMPGMTLCWRNHPAKRRLRTITCRATHGIGDEERLFQVRWRPPLARAAWFGSSNQPTKRPRCPCDAGSPEATQKAGDEGRGFQGCSAGLSIVTTSRARIRQLSIPAHIRWVAGAEALPTALRPDRPPLSDPRPRPESYPGTTTFNAFGTISNRVTGPSSRPWFPSKWTASGSSW